MIQFTLKLDNSEQRPILNIQTLNNISALLDTGAVFPVWLDDEGLISALGGVSAHKRLPIGGLGGVKECPMYRLPSLCIGELIYPNLPIAVNQMPDMPCQILLPATMFSGLVYEIDDYRHKLNITIPDGESNVRNLTVEDSGGRVHVLCHTANEESGVMPGRIEI